MGNGRFVRGSCKKCGRLKMVRINVTETRVTFASVGGWWSKSRMGHKDGSDSRAKYVLYLFLTRYGEFFGRHVSAGEVRQTETESAARIRTNATPTIYGRPETVQHAVFTVVTRAVAKRTRPPPHSR